MYQPKTRLRPCHPVTAGHPRHRPRHWHLLALVVTLALLLPGLAGADDASALYEQNCVSCHGSEVFTRPDRRVQSLGGLASQVRMCEQNLGLQWFDEDVQAVVGLLNREYYHFDQPAAD